MTKHTHKSSNAPRQQTRIRQKHTKRSGTSGPVISRRSIIVGAGASALLAGSGAIGLVACNKTKHEDASDASANLIDKDNFENMMKYDIASVDAVLEHEYELPLGSRVHVSANRFGAVITRNEEAIPLSFLGLFDFQTGSYHKTHEEASSQEGNFTLFDMRASDDMLAWLELDFDTQDWVLYTQNHSNGKRTGKVLKLDAGTKDITPPAFSIWRHKVYWQVIPSADGAKKSNNSLLYVWEDGKSSGVEIWKSYGHFATPPAISGDTLVICPRLQLENSKLYAPTAINCANDQMFDQYKMPGGVSPSMASYLDKKFALAIEASYGFGGLLGSMGTYFGREGTRFLGCSREPYAQAVQVGERYCIKNRGSMLVFHPDAKSYYRLPAVNNSTDWGDFPANEGLSHKLVVYATVKDAQSGLPSHVALRIYSFPKNTGEARQHTDRENHQVYEQAPITVVNPDGSQTTINPGNEAFTIHDTPNPNASSSHEESKSE